MSGVDSNVSSIPVPTGEAAVKNVNRFDALRARLLCGGHLVRFKGILASKAPSLAGISLLAGLAIAQPALAATTDCSTSGGTTQGTDCVVIDASGNPVNINYSDTAVPDLTFKAPNGAAGTTSNGINVVNAKGSITVNAGGTVTGGNGSDTPGSSSGVRVQQSDATVANKNITINVNTVTANTGGGHGSAIDVESKSPGGATSITATGTVTNTQGHAIRINGIDGQGNDGVVGGSLTINTKDIMAAPVAGGGDGIQVVGDVGTTAAPAPVSITTGDISAAKQGIEFLGSVHGDTTINTGKITTGMRAGTDTFTSGGGDGIIVDGTFGDAGAGESTSITTGDLDVSGTGVNLGSNINRTDGASTIKTDNITAGGMGVAVGSADNADQYLIDVETGNITSGSTGIGVRNSGTGGITVKTGNIDAGTAGVGNVTGFLGSAGGYGVYQADDPHGTTDSSGVSDVNITTGDITVTNRSAATPTFAGTGVFMDGNGNGNTMLTTGNISAGTGVTYNRTGTGTVDITTGDITATTGDGVNFGNDITHNDVSVTTGDITAAGYGVYGNTYVDAGKLDVTTGNVMAGNTAIYLIHSGQGPLSITTGDDITSTGGMGFYIQQDPIAGGAGGFVLNTKNVTAQGIGIELVQNDNVTGGVSIANTGSITSNGAQGVYVDQSAAGGNLGVTVNGVTAVGNALELYGDSTGNTTVTANGAVSSTGGYGVYVAKRNTGDVTIHTKDTVTAAGDAIALGAFIDGNISITTDKDITSLGANGIDLGGVANGGTDTGSVTITSAGDVKAAGIGINGDTGPNTTVSTISVADMDTTSTGINYIHSGTGPVTITSTGTINAGSVGISLTTDSAAYNTSTDSQTVINVNNITTPNNTAISLNSNAAKGSTINVNGALTTAAASDVAGDGMRLIESDGPLKVNIAKNASITSYNNTMELTNGAAGTTVNVDGSLKSTANRGGNDGVIWVWNTPGTTIVNINDGSTVQAVDPTGFAMTDNSGNSVVTVGNAAVTGGFRMGNGSDALTFNGTNMSNVGTLDGGDDATTADGMTDTLTLDGISNFTRNLQTAGQEVENWEAVNINGGTADLVGTMTTGQLALGKDASGNPAALTIGAGTVGDTLTVTGNYVGAGGGLTLDTDASTHTSDKLVVGGSTSGITALGLNDLTPTAGTSDRVDIEVVDVAGTSPGSAFVLANGPAMLGGTNYTLGQGDASKGQNVNDWFLVAQLCPPTAGQALGCVTPDTLTYDGTTAVSGNVEGAGGSDIINVTDGASVTGLVAGGDPGADASQSQDTDDSITINTTGSVGGVQGNLGDDLISVIGGSTVNGDVQGNQGSNQISIGSNAVGASGTPTVTGNVDGGNGTGTNTADGQNQIWVLGNAQVGGNVQAGGGGDKIVLNGAGATVTGAINGGVGNDVIDLMAGTADSVQAGDGNDNVQLGGATVTGAIDAGAGNNTLTLVGGTAQSAAAGDGNNVITLSGATIANGIKAGNGSNTVDLGKGAAASVELGDGQNRITLDGAKIGGAITAGNGIDTIALKSGSAASVTAGNGGDAVSLAGAKIAGAITTGSGADAITLSGGSAKSVAAGDGNNTVTLDGAKISGAITAGNGGNTIVLNGGSAASVTAGNGGNEVSLAGAGIAGAITAGSGNDTIDLTSGTVGGGVNAGAGVDTVNVAGETFTLGTTKLDGGMAGEGNTLNLNNVNQTLTSPQSHLVNWDTINASDSSLTVHGGDLLTATQVNLINSTLNARNGGFRVNGNLSLDPSTIDMQNGHAGDAFTVTGNYAAVGSGNKLAIDADFVGNVADELKVGGKVTGTTQLDVNNVTVDKAESTGKDVVVAKSATAGGISAENFSLSTPVISGIYDYGLANGSVPGTVVLRGHINTLGAVYNAAMGTLANTFGSLPTLERRVGQRQWLARDNDGVFEGAWLRINGGRATTTPAQSTIDFSTHDHSWGAQVGVDFRLLDSSDGRLTAGITGQYKSMSADVSTTTATGGIRADGSGGGANLTWSGIHGEFADLQAQYDKVHATMTAPEVGTVVNNAGMISTAASLEIGKRFVVGSNRHSVLVPQAQVSWGQLSASAFTDSQGRRVDLGTDNTSWARIGLAYEYHPDGVDMLTPDKDGRMFYVIGNILQNLAPGNTVTVYGTSLHTRSERTWGEVGFGGSLTVRGNVLLYGEVYYRTSLADPSSARNHGMSGTVGLRVDF